MTKTHTPEIESAPMAPAGETHAVVNVGRELPDYDAYSADDALVAAVSRYGATSAEDEIRAFGLRAGSADYRALGHLANKYKPELDTHDRFGRRVDVVRYHDAYHALMQAASEERLHSRPWVEPQPGSMVARAAKYVMQGGRRGGPYLPDHDDLRVHPKPPHHAFRGGALGGEGPRSRIRRPQRADHREALGEDRHGA